MNWTAGLRQAGVPAALGAALLFGAGTPLAKLLLTSVDPWLLAGLLYLGSGIGLTLYRRLNNAPAVRLPRHEQPWFAGAIVAGGIVGPVLLMLGLTGMPASGGLAVERRRRIHGPAGLVRFQGKLRPTDCAGHGRHRSRCRGLELAG